MASLPPGVSIESIARDPLWFPYRYDPGHDAVHFRPLSRADHRRATFLTDEYLGAAEPVVIRRHDVMAAQREAAPLHFIFHSAFCCSTLLARVFDTPGKAMGLKEPMILQDIVGWKHRGGEARMIAPVLSDILDLLARPFGQGEAVVVKPSNVANSLAPAIMAMQPGARAVMLHAPLRVYLGSIVRKGITGRLWVRDLLMKQLKEGLHPFGFSPQDYMGQTDLQVAAIGWLAQHALFVKMAEQFGDRVAAMDSETLMASPGAAVTALSGLFNTDIDGEAAAGGPAFVVHSKSGARFSAEDRRAEQAAETAHADEIGKVLIWAEEVAKTVDLPMILPGQLLA